MKGQELLRKLIVRAPPDLLAAIYERVRSRNTDQAEGATWEGIAGQAQEVGIFTPEEAVAFLQLIAKRVENAA
ncbi:MAG: hypothetical protein ACE5K9_09245 [Candidatus Methylomirabilales bacterium]